MTPLKTRILLVDDHALVRRGLRLVLDAEPDLEVVAEAGDGAEAIELALATVLDLAIIDISMPRMTGLQAVAELRKRRPELRTLILSDDNADPRVLAPGCDEQSSREDPLTPREQEVIKLIAESYSTRQIADVLVISEKTVDRHRANILEKLGMHDRVQLTRYAIRRGLVEP